MPTSPSEWDSKHRLAADAPAPEPASIVRELLPLLSLGPALDLACGVGRHALLLAGRAQHVTAVDWSGVALDLLEARARNKGISVRRVRGVDRAGKSAPQGIDLIHADLERIEISPHRYELILCIQYLQRSLFPQIARALRPGGVLLFETFTHAQLGFTGGPRNPDYLLDTGELREAFPELRVLFYRELCAEQGIASLVARKLGKKN